MAKKIDISYELIYKMYILEELSTTEIASELGCGRQTISNKLHKYNIPVREISRSLRVKKNLNHDKKIYVDETLVCNLYDRLGYPANVISDIVGCSIQSIYKKLKENNIKIRSRSECHIKTRIPEHLLRSYYIDQKIPAYKISEMLGCSHKCVLRNMLSYNIPIRSQSEIQRSRKMSFSSKHKLSIMRIGDKNPAWKGGVHSKNQKERNSSKYRKWRKSVFERDNYTCSECGCYGGILNAHHIIPFSMSNDLRYDINNGETLCKYCHNRRHFIEKRNSKS